MAKSQSGLGRDFYSILDDNVIETSQGGQTTVQISKIEPRKDQPRQDFDQNALQALADSIAEHGVLQPIIIREYEGTLAGNYEIIAGERRWRAAKMAGLSEIPAIIFTGDDLKVAQVALIENLQRQDLNAVEEALAYKALIDRFRMTQEEVARQVGKNRSTIANLLRLLELPDEVLIMLRDGKISMGHARALLALEDTDDMIALAERIWTKDLSVREVEATVRRMLAAAEDMPTAEDDGQLQRKVYMKDLEQRVMTRMGRKVRIHQTGRKHTVELTYENDEDLEDLLKRIAGEDVFA